MKLNKKALLALGTISAVVAPIAATVSCASIGQAKKRETKNADGMYTGIELRMGVRLDEQGFLKNAIDEFENATGAIVEMENATPGNYSPVVASNQGLADVTLVEGEDTNVQSQTEGWFEAFKPEDLLKKPEYNSIQYHNGYELDPNTDITDNSQTDTATMRSALGKIGRYGRGHNKEKMNYLPAVFGPRMIYGWRKNAVNKDMYDGKHNLKWFVPIAINAKPTNGKRLEEVTFTGSNSPLLKSDGTPYKNTVEDVKEFLMNSARESQRTFNQADYTHDNLVSSDANDRVIATGPEGYRQRLYSVAATLRNAFPDGAKGILEYTTIDIAMVANGMSAILQHGDPNKRAYDGNMIDDDKWAKGFEGASTTADTHNKQWDLVGNNDTTTNAIPDLYIKTWLGHYGYLNDGVAATKANLPSRISTEVQGFSEHLTNFVNSQKWMQPSILSQTHTNINQIEDKFVSFPTPFSDPGVDGYAVKNGLEGKKHDAAFALLRFLLQEKVNYEMCGSKTLPIMNRSKRAMIASPTVNMFDKTAASSGMGTIQANDRLQYGVDIVSRSSNKNILNKISITAEKTAWAAANKSYVTWNEFTARMEDVRHQWKVNQMN